ncbi:MAG TPA: adenylate/guanylate cyclase domain-containing protein [Gaiellaceae bacterium]|nr:adenylate/guanylate cyclase domain-containing protein [Gaiellaceae bacterium]
MAVCPSCGKELPGEFPFCPFCGVALTAVAPGPAHEERKVVSVLFADLVGFTTRAETMDPEDVRALLSPYHARLRAELERFGGTVEKFIGDAVMALFGAPVAHEDDPERAVRAALAIRRYAGDEGIELRIGITTGEALVRLSARPELGETVATGDVVNTAARLQSAAPVNGVLVDETTYRATRHAVDYRDAVAVQAKGKADPIPVWEALDARARFGVDVTHHARTELVGRERELSVLRDALDRARQERVPQLVTLVAVPGMGKSRLVYELSRIVDADPELITWRQGRCLAYGDGVAFWALAEVVKAQAGILERDTEAATAEKLRAAVVDAIGDAADARWVESHLRPLVGLESETLLGGDRRGEAFAAWRRYLEALAEQRPVVLVLEDLHWADEGLLDFVDELVDWLSGVALLVVCSARPELLERRPGWGGGKLNASTLALSPLSQQQTAVLISQVLERALLPAEIQQALLERAGGNPLYAEQFAELYLERGSAEDLPLPETLQGILAARLDGLSADAKALLQDAAVIGKVFWTGALRRGEREATELLHGLERKGFVTRQRRSSVESEGEWAFAHMLLRDVAYGQIPRAERAGKHRLVAEWIDSLGRPEDHGEMLAHHWRAALELARATGLDTGHLAERTRVALRGAGDRAFALNAYDAAEGYYDEALGLWPPDDERPGLLFRRAHALYLAGDERREPALEEARDALVAAGNREEAGEAAAFLARSAWYRGSRDEAFSHLASAEELVAGGSASAAKAHVLTVSARLRTLAGERQEGLRLADQALELARRLELAELEAHALTTIGTAKIDLRDPDARSYLERGLEIAVAANSPEAATILNNLAVEAILAGDVRREDELLVEAHRTAERFGDRDTLRFNRGNRIWTRWSLGHWDEAAPAADAFIAECTSSPHYLETTARSIRAYLRLARGDREGALADSRRALELGRQIRDPQTLLPALLQSARCCALLDRIDEAQALAAEALELIGEHVEYASMLGQLGPVARRLGLRDEIRRLVEQAPEGPWKEVALAEAGGEFSRAADLYAAFGSPTLEAEARLCAAQELIEAGRRAEGEAELRKALAFYRTVGATGCVEQGEALRAASA